MSDMAIQKPFSISGRIFLGGLFLLVIILYLGSLPKEFTNWDDDRYIAENPSIRSLSLRNLQSFATNSYVANYLPVTMFSYALDYQLWRLNPLGFHFHNVALHLGCILLVYFILKRLGFRDWLLYLPVALFALHPTNVESISWASERKNLLSAIFFLASFHQYILYKETANRPRYLQSVFFFLLSLLSKATSVTAPLLFLAFDYLFYSRKIRRLPLYDKIPFLVMAELMSFWTIHAAQTDKAFHSYHQQGIWINLLNAPRLLFEYFQILLLPLNITATYVDHQLPTLNSLTLWAALPAIGLIFFYIYRQDRLCFFGLLFFLILLLPVLNILPLPIKIANRYLYLPQLGFWVMGASLFHKGFKRLHPFRLIQGLALSVLLIWMGGLSLITWNFARVWRNSGTLWESCAEIDPRNATANYNLGHYYTRRDQLQRGAVYLLNSARLAPDSPGSHNGLGHYFFLRKQYDLAIAEFQTALSVAPDFDPALNNLGNSYMEKGEPAKGFFYFS
jgi:tetratricopeptide (TPR) repeat protein